MMTRSLLARRSALVIGLGGLGCPAALALARAGVGHLVLCDDDVVQASNLHRQILYRDDDIGRDKLDAARDALLREGAERVTVLRTRFLPENARELLNGIDVALEGSDNFATKFLVADAGYLSRVPVVHGAAVRFTGTAWSVGPQGAPCYRCLFEDVLEDSAAPNCSDAGILGPVVGVVGAMMADLALDVLLDDPSRRNRIFTFDGKTQRLRSVEVTARVTCPLCGPQACISTLNRETYLAPTFTASCPRESRPSSHA